MSKSIGKAYLVGAGPGDPGLLTLRGAECLRSADVVLYDYLASPHLLALARPGAELICLGRHGHGRLLSQREINGAVVRHALAGRTVVRLKGGDPAIFGRLADEMNALEAAQVPYEIVPGVTAAQAASSYASIPLTDRDEASCVAFVTGQEQAQKASDTALDYAALAKFPGTLVFYMGVTTADIWSRALLDNGKSAATPTAVVRRCSLPDQETFFTTLGELSTYIATHRIRPPAIIIVGEVVQQRDLPNWFTTRRVFGRTILLTRPEQQAVEMVARLLNLGANVLLQPAIEITALSNWAAVDDAINRISEFDWLVFSSRNGVEYLLGRVLELGHDMRYFKNTKLAAIGPGTAAALDEFHLRADLQPDVHRAEELAEALAPQARGKKVLLARASRGREILAQMLAASGATVEQVVVYESRDVETPNEEVAEALAAGNIDFVTVTSSAIARSLVRLFGESLRKTRLAAISPLTAKVLSECGYPPAIVAETFSTEGLIEAILVSTPVKT